MSPRIRTVKPELFTHEGLADADAATGLPCRLAFIGLFCCADREGRFEWRPRRLKVQILPYDDCDFARVLDALRTRDFIEKYQVDGREYGFIPGFLEHQVINNRERASKLPAPPESNDSTRAARVDDASSTPLVRAPGERKGTTRGNGSEKRVGDALTPSSTSSPPTPDPTTFITLPLNDRTEYAITEADLQEWRELYPAVDVPQQLRNMKGWLDSNPAKRKTRRGVRNFITSWLAKEQNRGPGNGSAPPPTRPAAHRQVVTGQGYGLIDDKAREGMKRFADLGKELLADQPKTGTGNG